ncbi:TPA: FidL-like protein [Salmonella enterica]
MKKIIISAIVVMVLIGGTVWFSTRISGTELSCNSTFEKNTANGSSARGMISVHLFRDHSGVASVTGKIITADGIWTINRETGFTYEAVDGRKGMLRIKKTSFRKLSRDNMPARYDDDISMNTDSQNSDYLIIRKINKNTLLFTSPVAPFMLCVSE